MNKQVVYLLSTDYAGSHFLALQLGSHPQCASLGEPLHQRKRDAAPRACNRCESEDVCPVYKGIRDEPTERFYDRFLENLAKWDSRINTAIDNSKKIRWAQDFVDRPGFDKKYIHLIRDPRALVRRWMLTFDTPKMKGKKRRTMARRFWPHAWDILTGDQENVYIWKWLYQNKMITEFIENNNLDAQLVTYHDLVFHPNKVLGDLMKWIGHTYDPSQKEYWNSTHHGTVKSLYIKPPENTDKIFDQRWKTFLDEGTQMKIWHHPQIKKYLDSIGLTFDVDTGLCL